MSRLPKDISLTDEQVKTIINQLLDALRFNNPVINYQGSYGKAAPPAAWLREGMIAYANGSDWSPGGGGAGYYRYDTTLTDWMPVYADTWDDLPPIPIDSLKLGGAGADPTFAAFLGNTKLYTFAVNDEVFGQQEILHGYKEGTAIKPHVHWATNSSADDVGDRTVKWELEYTMANDTGTAFGATTVITGESTIPEGTADYSPFKTYLTDISGTGIEIGAYIVYRFRRIASTGTEPDQNPFGLAIGFHTLNNTDGSRQIGDK